MRRYIPKVLWLFLWVIPLADLSGLSAQDKIKIISQDCQIDAVDPGIKLFVRMKMAEGDTTFNNQNIVLFIHGATYPSTPDFDLQYEDYIG